MAAPALPGSAFAGRTLVLKDIGAGEIWRRLYESRFPNPLGWGHRTSRFSDPTGRGFGIVYLGSIAKVAFVETILRDRADGRGADCMVAMAEIERRSLASIQTNAALRLVDLTGDGPLRMGVPSDVAGARDQTLAQVWSAAFHAHPEQPDGVYYPSRLNEEGCLALYDRAVGKLRAVAAPRLLDCPLELAAILNDLEIGDRLISGASGTHGAFMRTGATPSAPALVAGPALAS